MTHIALANVSVLHMIGGRVIGYFQRQKLGRPLKQQGGRILRELLIISGLLLALPSYADTITGKVVSIADGDTITVLSGTTPHKIRLMGIDAPEKKQAFGNKSKETLASAIAGKSVTVDYNKRDRYQRIIGKVIYQGQDMNLRQVQLGMAWHYKQYEREQDLEDRSKYAQAEYLAQRDRLGLWADAKAVPPWEFRKAVKKK